MKVSGKSHSPENPEESFMLAKRLKGDPLETWQKNFEKQNENFEESHSAKKSERRDPLGFFNIRSVAKYLKK